MLVLLNQQFDDTLSHTESQSDFIEVIEETSKLNDDIKSIERDESTMDSASSTEYLKDDPEQTKQPKIKKAKLKRRVKNKANWKRIKAQERRLAGLSYVSVTKKEVSERKLKEPCSCRFKCYEIIPEKERQAIFDHFWKTLKQWVQRRQYISTYVTKSIKARRLAKNTNWEEDRRKYNLKYTLNVRGEILPVCKVMFLNTLCIGDRFVRNCVFKQN